MRSRKRAAAAGSSCPKGVHQALDGVTAGCWIGNLLQPSDGCIGILAGPLLGQLGNCLVLALAIGEPEGVVCGAQRVRLSPGGKDPGQRLVASRSFGERPHPGGRGVGIAVSPFASDRPECSGPRRVGRQGVEEQGRTGRIRLGESLSHSRRAQESV